MIGIISHNKDDVNKFFGHIIKESSIGYDKISIYDKNGFKYNMEILYLHETIKFDDYEAIYYIKNLYDLFGEIETKIINILKDDVVTYMLSSGRLFYLQILCVNYRKKITNFPGNVEKYLGYVEKIFPPVNFKLFGKIGLHDFTKKHSIISKFLGNDKKGLDLSIIKDHFKLNKYDIYTEMFGILYQRTVAHFIYKPTKKPIEFPFIFIENFKIFFKKNVDISNFIDLLMMVSYEKYYKLFFKKENSFPHDDLNVKVAILKTHVYLYHLFKNKIRYMMNETNSNYYLSKITFDTQNIVNIYVYYYYVLFFYEKINGPTEKYRQYYELFKTYVPCEEKSYFDVYNPTRMSFENLKIFEI